VLPGSAQVCPPFQQKFTAIRRKYTVFGIFFKFRYFSAISRHFPLENFEEKKHIFSLLSIVLSFLIVQISPEQNSAIFPLLFDKLIAVPLSTFRRF
jgi:hypothetical protein